MLKTLTRKKSRAGDDGRLFSDLSPAQQQVASKCLNRSLAKWRNMGWKPWRYPVLIAAAKCVALYPRDRAWGLRMAAKRGGKARARTHPYSREYMRHLGQRGRERRRFKAEIEKKKAQSPDGRLRLRNNLDTLLFRK